MEEAMRRIHVLVMMIAILVAAGSAWGKDKDKKTPPPAPASEQSAQKDAIIDRIFYQEAKLGETMQTFTPMVETYIQNLKPDADMGTAPSSDAYFLGRLVLNEKGLHNQRFVKKTGFRNRI